MCLPGVHNEMHTHEVIVIRVYFELINMPVYTFINYVHKYRGTTLTNQEKMNADAWKWQKQSHFSALEIQSELASQAFRSVWADTFFLLKIFLPPVTSQAHTYFCHICCFHTVNSQDKSVHLFFSSESLSLSCFGMATSINLSSFQIAVLETSSVFQRSSSNQRVTLANGTGAGNTIHIYQQAISYFSCDFSISVSCSLSQSASVSYPLRSWWAPGGAAAWSRRTPAPRCPPSAAPLSPRSRSASLHPRPTPRHHTPTRTRSPSRPPRPQDHRQDQCSHPAPHSSSPAPTPALHRPTRTGRAPPGTRLLPTHSLNPVWVRLRWDEVESKKYWPQVCEEPEVIKNLSDLEGSLRNYEKLTQRGIKSTHADLSASSFFFFPLFANEETRENLWNSALLWQFVALARSFRRTDCLAAK